MKIRLYSCETYQRREVTSPEELKDAIKEGYVPSVTEIVKLIEETDYLTNWMIKESIQHYMKNGSKENAIKYRNTESSEFGTTCHELCECYLNGTTFDGKYDERHVDSVGPFKKWADEYVEKPIFTESFFANSVLMYGGTADMLLKMKNGDTLLADLKFKKNSKFFPLKPSYTYKVQLSAYRAHFKIEHGKMKTANLLLSSPFGTNKAPFLKVCDYGYEDHIHVFEVAKQLWFLKHQVNI